MDYAAKQDRQEKDDQVEFEVGSVVLSFDLRKIARALARVGEVAVISKSTAQELSADFNDSMSSIQQIINRAEAACSAAEEEVEQIRGRILLDEVPAILAEKGMKDSEDRRKAVIANHPDFLEALEKRRYMQWVVRNLRAKHRRVYDANRTALAVLGERGDYHRGSSSGGAPTASVGRGQNHPGVTPKFGATF